MYIPKYLYVPPLPEYVQVYIPPAPQSNLDLVPAAHCSHALRVQLNSIEYRHGDGMKNLMKSSSTIWNW